MHALVSAFLRGAEGDDIRKNANPAAKQGPDRRSQAWRVALPSWKAVTALVLLAGMVATHTLLDISANAARLDHQHVINLAGKQRMLTQKLAKETLLVALGVETEANLRSMGSTRSLFDLTLTGLRHGEASLGLPRTADPEVLELLGRVETLWADLDRSLQPVLESGEPSQAQVAALAELNVPLLKAMNEVVLAYEKSTYGGVTFSVNSAAINLSGRQRMLTQKMTKEFLLIAYGHDTAGNREALGETIALFDRTLNGLISGDPENRLVAAPNTQILAQLGIVQQIWGQFSAYLRPVAAEKAPTPDTIAVVAEMNLELLYEMNKAVELYEAL